MGIGIKSHASTMRQDRVNSGNGKQRQIK